MFKKCYKQCSTLFFSNADPSGKGSTKEWVEKLIIVGYPKAATSVHITGQSQTHIKRKSQDDVVILHITG